jgi:hypothetical protein
VTAVLEIASNVAPACWARAGREKRVLCTTSANEWYTLALKKTASVKKNMVKKESENEGLLTEAAGL